MGRENKKKRGREKGRERGRKKRKGGGRGNRKGERKGGNIEVRFKYSLSSYGLADVFTHLFHLNKRCTCLC